MQQQQDIKPAFEIEALEGTEKVTRSYFDDGVLKNVKEDVPKGWNVYLPSGQSLRIRDKKEMHRLGLLEVPELLDMESDEPVAQPKMSLKTAVRRKTKSRKKPSATSGVMKDG